MNIQEAYRDEVTQIYERAILHVIEGQIRHFHAKNINHFEGATWFYGSVENVQSLMPTLSEIRSRSIIKSLVSKGDMIESELNREDGAKWVTIPALYFCAGRRIDL